MKSLSLINTTGCPLSKFYDLSFPCPVCLYVLQDFAQEHPQLQYDDMIRYDDVKIIKSCRAPSSKLTITENGALPNIVTSTIYIHAPCGDREK